MNNRHRVFISIKIMSLFFSSMTLAMDLAPRPNYLDQNPWQYNQGNLDHEREEFEEIVSDIGNRKASCIQTWDEAVKGTVDKYFPCCVQPPEKKFAAFLNICNQTDIKDRLICKVMERKWLNLTAYPPVEIAKALTQMNLHYFQALDETNLKAYRHSSEEDKKSLTTPAAEYSFHSNNIARYFKFVLSMDPKNNIAYFIDVLDELFWLGNVTGCFLLYPAIADYDELLPKFKKPDSSELNLGTYNIIKEVFFKAKKNAWYEFGSDESIKYRAENNLLDMMAIFKTITNENYALEWKKLTLQLYQVQEKAEKYQLNPNSELLKLFIHMPKLVRNSTTRVLRKLALGCPNQTLVKSDAKKLKDMSPADLVCYVEQFGKKESLRKTFLMGHHTGEDIEKFLEPLLHKVYVLRHLLGIDGSKAQHLAQISGLIPATTSDIIEEPKEDLGESDSPVDGESSSSGQTDTEHKTPSPQKYKKTRSIRSLSGTKSGKINAKKSAENVRPPKLASSKSPDTPFVTYEEKKKNRGSEGKKGKISPRKQHNNGVVRNEMPKIESSPEGDEPSLMLFYPTARSTGANPQPAISVNDFSDFLGDATVDKSLGQVGSNIKTKSRENS